MELQKYFSKFLRQKNKKISEKDLMFSTAITNITGYGVNNIEIYREAFTLKSASDKKGKNYERLEFLGDSILGSIIACHLFQTYPSANEGYLTQMKSKIVNRKNLNRLGEDLKLTQFLDTGCNTMLSENLCGNLFEAFVGAIYLDLGYDACKRIVFEKLLTPTEIHKLENKIVSYKGLLLEWSQKKKCTLRYETCEEVLPNKCLAFRTVVWMNEEKIANAAESSKKKAEEKAAQRAFYILNKKEHILEKPKAVSGG